jgi:hypothetical protein
MQHFATGWYMGISDGNRGTLKRFPSIEEDVGMMWLEETRILYYGDSQAWEITPAQLLEIERKAEAGSTSAYFGGVNVILRYVDAQGQERRVRRIRRAIDDERAWRSSTRSRMPGCMEGSSSGGWETSGSVLGRRPNNPT